MNKKNKSKEKNIKSNININKTQKFKNGSKDIKNKAKYESDNLSSSFDLKEYQRKKATLTSFFLDKKYEPMTFKQLMYLFNIPKSSYNTLSNMLDKLISQNVIALDGKKYISVKNQKLYTCKYVAKNNFEGYALDNESGEIKAYISANSIAMDNDIVAVKLLNNFEYVPSTLGTNNKIKIGKIVKIIKRDLKFVFGRYLKRRNIVEPLNNKINNIYILKKGSIDAKDDQLVKVEITKYPASDSNSNKIEGKIVEIIGNSDDPKAEVASLFLSYGLDQLLETNELIKKELISIPDELQDFETKNRVDKTKDRLYTIDAADAMDLDDAVGIKKQGDYFYLSVCIADVSHYVKASSALDQDAIQKGTSIYIPGTVIPMLPKKLSNGICSLNQDQKRLSLAIDIKIDKNGNVIDSNIYKAVIKVCKKMSYDKVYKVILNQDEEVLKEYKEYKDDIFLMKQLSQILKNKRQKEGSLDFDIPETQVILDDKSNLKNIKAYDINIANNIIEEFMLIANMCIAKRFYFLKAPFIYRVHEKPDIEKLNALNEILANYNLKINGIKNIHTKEMADILKNIKDDEQKDVISKIMLKTLKLAKYSDNCLGHFGLAFKYYCHFTSPIRRYPDLFIHRVISDYIDNNYVLDDKKINEYTVQAKKYAKISSDMENSATKIERDFDNLYMALFMKDKIGQVYDAVISSINSFGMFVRLTNTIEGMVPFSKLDDYYIFDDKKFRLIGKRKGKVYKIGDKVKAKVIRVDVKSKQIDFCLI